VSAAPARTDARLDVVWGVVSEHPGPIAVESRVRFALRAVARTDPGLQRTVNEDAMYCDEQVGVFVVCDGMGGHASGQVASDLAIQTVMASMRAGLPPPQGGEPLVAALLAANHAVLQRSLSDPACHGMGTTAVGLRADADSFHVCHCGDSRAYLLRGGQLGQLTRDHSLVNLYADKPELAGQMGPAASNVIVRAIGLDERVEVDHQVVAMAEGDVFLLCCDGLTDLVADWMIRDIMTTGATLEEVGDTLIRAANNNGGSDNITVILVAVYGPSRAVDADEFQYTRPGF
jgi:PPM family protein phosphatase